MLHACMPSLREALPHALHAPYPLFVSVLSRQSLASDPGRLERVVMRVSLLPFLVDNILQH
jgi:hypothetical protein